jgi:hypothetical protein
MKKCYDSVSLKSLEIALKRVALPECFIQWLLSIFHERQMSVITTKGLSPQFIGLNGIDQGDAISPLLWKLFYDPLLAAIELNKHLGYKMVTHWPKDVNCRESWQSISAKIPTVAYMDDTAFIDSCQERVQSTIKSIWPKNFTPCTTLKLIQKRLKYWCSTRRRPKTKNLF